MVVKKRTDNSAGVIGVQLRLKSKWCQHWVVQKVSLMCSENDWTTDCCAGLTDTILDQNCTVKVLSVASDLCSVEMSVAGRDVAQDLVRDGFAVTSFHPPKSTTTDIPPFLPL